MALSKVFSARQDSPLNTAVWWIEHLLRHGRFGHDLLKSQAVHLNWFVYYSVDCILIFVGSAAIIIFLFVQLIKKTIRTKQKKNKQKSN